MPDGLKQLNHYAMIACLALCTAIGNAAPGFAFEVTAEQAIIYDGMTDTMLLSKSAQDRMYPSSMSKLMTLYILFDRLKSGAITLDSTFPVSEKAWKKGGSKMFVEVNTSVRVEDLIRGIIVQSGNDACIVVADALGGSEEGFASIMNEYAQKLGLRGSHFMNATGWPDPEHYMTASDLVTLSRALVHDFPDYYPYFGEESFTYSDITQSNRNELLDDGIGVDGLKTGHTEAAGYGIAVSAVSPEHGARRIFVVVNGLESSKDRTSEARRLVEHGLRDFVPKTLKQKGEAVLDVPVWRGSQEVVALSLPRDLQLSLPRNAGKVRFELAMQTPIPAPVQQGESLAQLSIYYGDTLAKTLPLQAQNAVEQASFLSRVWDNLFLLADEL